MSDAELVSAERMRQTASSCGWSMEELSARYLQAARKDLDALEGALSAQLAADAARIAHGLAGASEMAGIPGMGILLREIEEVARKGDLPGACALAEEAETCYAALRRLLRP